MVLLTTITFNSEISISKFNINKIYIENSSLVKEEDIKKLLAPIYGENLFLLNNNEIKNILMKNTLIKGFKLKKKYPNKLKIKIFEKKPFVILFDKKKKFYLSETIDLIKIEDLPNYKELPTVFGTKNDFKILNDNLMKIDFPFNQVKKYTMYENKRWDLLTINNVLIKLPPKNYIKSLENYLSLINKNNFKKYNLFDYRISNQLILK